jgi:hypothetical protein
MVSSPLEVEVSGRLNLVLATGWGLLVANLYFGQPLAGPISSSIGLTPAMAGLTVTLTQAG